MTKTCVLPLPSPSFSYPFSSPLSSLLNSNFQGGVENKGALKFNVLVTTYEMIIQDKSLFRSITWELCIIDEAHRLKNKESKLTTELGNLTYKFIVLLTGTPVQNNTEELWTLLNIIDSKNFRFVKKYPACSFLILYFFPPSGANIL
jgi:SNF2 family DNA or RNA helicase